MRNAFPQGIQLKRQEGFTLLELLLAIAIFSVVSVLAYGGLKQVQIIQERVDDQGERLADLQMAFTIINKDIRQSINRPVRDAFGSDKPAMEGGGGGYGRIVEFTRNGLRNPTSRVRSHLQRVAYEIRDDQLIRLVWPTLDVAQGVEPSETVLLEHVKVFSLRYLPSDDDWTTEWPRLTANGQSQELPRAIEVTLDVEGWGEMTRFFQIVG
jgi:general secretion pathway protein J